MNWNFADMTIFILISLWILCGVIDVIFELGFVYCNPNIFWRDFWNKSDFIDYFALCVLIFFGMFSIIISIIRHFITAKDFSLWQNPIPKYKSKKTKFLEKLQS